MKRKWKQGFTLLEMTPVISFKNTYSDFVILSIISVFFPHYTISQNDQNGMKKELLERHMVGACVDLLGLNTIDEEDVKGVFQVVHRWINMADPGLVLTRVD